MKKAVSLFFLFFLMNFVFSQTCPDLSQKIDKMDLQRQVDYINLKSEINMQENRTKQYIDARISYMQQDQKSSFAQLEAELKKWVQQETNPYKFAIPFLFLWLSMISTSIFLKYYLR